MQTVKVFESFKNSDIGHSQDVTYRKTTANAHLL